MAFFSVITNTFFLLSTLEQKTSCSVTDWQAEMTGTGNGKWFRVSEFPAASLSGLSFGSFCPWSSPERRRHRISVTKSVFTEHKLRNVLAAIQHVLHDNAFVALLRGGQNVHDLQPRDSLFAIFYQLTI